MLKDIFAGTPQHEYYLQLTREEVEQERLQTQSNILLMIVQSRFPKLAKLAKAQAQQVKDVSVLEGIVGKVGAARTKKEAEGALLNWLPDDSEDFRSVT